MIPVMPARTPAAQALGSAAPPPLGWPSPQARGAFMIDRRNDVRASVPRDKENDYTAEAAAARREFLRQRTGADIPHVASFSFDPAVLAGNVENFIGVAQVP